LSDGMGLAKDVPKAIELLQKTCDAGYALGCRNLGIILRDGRGTGQDLARAEKLLDTACTAGALFGCTNAGALDALLAGREGPPRYKKMLDHYTLGCNAGDPSACRKVGVAYLEGKALPKSPTAAAVWLDKAVAKGDVIAARLLGMMAIDGVGV